MNKNEISTIKTSVVSGIILIIISLIIPISREYILKFFSLLGNMFSSFWSFLSSTYPVYGWVLIIAGISVLIIILEIFSALKNIGRNSEVNNFKSYKEDIIFNVKWRWEWISNSIENLWCFCPTCDATLVYTDNTVRHYLNNENKVDFTCENCDIKLASIPGSTRYDALNFIKRELERRIRTGEYKK